jgi:predicted RNA-binding Zn-ribbon protein involved in translation (DUF1610 family)
MVNTHNVVNKILQSTKKVQHDISSKNKIYPVHAVTFEERYFDCPACGALVSDNGPSSNTHKFSVGSYVPCPECGVINRVKKVYESAR